MDNKPDDDRVLVPSGSAAVAPPVVEIMTSSRSLLLCGSPK